MKKLLIFLLILFPLVCNATKMTDFTEDTSPTSDDIFWTTNAPGTSPADRKVTLGNLLLWIAAQTVSVGGTWTMTTPVLDTPTFTLADDSTLTIPTTASTYDSGLLGCATDGTCSWIDPSSLLTSVDLSSVTISGGTASRMAEWDGSGNLTSSDTATTGTGAPVKGTSPQISEIQLGHASDTTIARASAGVMTVEGVTVTRTIASGTSALGTSEIAAGNHASLVTTSATGTLTTDVIAWNFNADPHGVTGYAPSTNGGLFIYAYPTADNVNFLVVNNTAAAITPGAITLNWKVLR